MDETPGTEPRTAAPRKRGRGLLWAFIAVVVAFGAGFGWQFYEASQVRTELAETQQELRIERLRVRLGQAAIAAQTGDYESARQRMSAFFTRLAEVSPTLPEATARVANEFLAMRDEVITGLSRANPEYAGVLYGMLDRFRTAAGLGEEMEPSPATPTTTPAAQPDTGMAPDTQPEAGAEAGERPG